MRAFLFKLAGLALHISELQSGTLHLTHKRSGKVLRTYTLNEEDFEGGADIFDHDAAAKMGLGIHLSAVGLQLCLTKNEGMLTMGFEGKNGGMAKWTFNSMDFMGGGKVSASAFTQTGVGPSRCLTCGEEIVVVPTVSNGKIRPKQGGMQEADTQTDPMQLRDSKIQTDASIIQSSISTRFSESKKETEVTSLSNNPFKRKGQGEEKEDIPPPLHKRAKSAHNSPPWPLHIYMTCYRTNPIFKGDVGTLHIDVREGTVWFEGWYGKTHMRVFERKQVDLRDTTTRVAYYRHMRAPGGRLIGVDGSTHYLTVSRLGATLQTITIFTADCSAPGWKMWSSNAPDDYHNSNARGTHPITNPIFIVDAIVHCIDRASGRQAVHDPNAIHKLRKDVAYYEGLKKQGTLSESDMEKYNFTLDELKTRKEFRKGVRIIEYDGAVESESQRG
ncbi:hypothetical protein BKA66DRAFT_436108 [Pyrenochaeta sp. MPI-SDFR-AT-0127]|nr:hypothetical protein BKA66DRAFT_436108 [Pyrenochaeta sp. MPI-SDFR-AT-0127]